jgi:hypothetical protein
MSAMCRLGNIRLDDRSPQDMIEEFVASQSLVAPWMGPANDMREVVQNHPVGPLSDYYIMPEFMRVPSPSCTLPTLVHGDLEAVEGFAELAVLCDPHQRRLMYTHSYQKPESW